MVRKASPAALAWLVPALLVVAPPRPCHGRELPSEPAVFGRPPVDVVVAHYTEDLSWIKDYEAPGVRFLVYSKGPLEDDHTVEYLPNIGRESHTYLHHIVSNYDDLAPWTVFTQGQAPAWGYQSGFSGSGHLSDNVTFQDYLQPFPEGRESFFVLSAACHIPKGVQATRLGIMVRGLQGPGSGNGLCPIGRDRGWTAWWFDAHHPHHRFGHRMLDFYNREVLRRPSTGKPATLAFAQGARFAVSQRRIRARPRSYYSHLLELLSKERDPIEGYFMEAMWHSVFAPEPEGGRGAEAGAACELPARPGSGSFGLGMEALYRDAVARIGSRGVLSMAWLAQPRRLAGGTGTDYAAPGENVSGINSTSPDADTPGTNSTVPEVVYTPGLYLPGPYVPGVYLPGLYVPTRDPMVLAVISVVAVVRVSEPLRFVRDAPARHGMVAGMAITTSAPTSSVEVEMRPGGPTPRRLSSIAEGLVTAEFTIKIPCNSSTPLTVRGVVSALLAAAADLPKFGATLSYEVNGRAQRASATVYSLTVMSISKPEVEMKDISGFVCTNAQPAVEEKPWHWTDLLTDRNMMIAAAALAFTGVFCVACVFGVKYKYWDPGERRHKEARDESKRLRQQVHPAEVEDAADAAGPGAGLRAAAASSERPAKELACDVLSEATPCTEASEDIDGMCPLDSPWAWGFGQASERPDSRDSGGSGPGSPRAQPQPPEEVSAPAGPPAVPSLIPQTLSPKQIEEPEVPEFFDDPNVPIDDVVEEEWC